jgi:hypothetical protein
MIKLMRMRWAGFVACMGKMRNALKYFLGKCEWKRLFGRH